MKITALVLALILAGCTAIPYQREYDAYLAYIGQEVGAGRMSLAQGNYLLAQKENELRARSSAALQAGIYGAYPGAALAAQGAQRTPAGGTTCVQTGTIVTCR